MDPVDDVRSDLEAATSESDYAAVNTLWLALLKLANLEEGRSERDRILSLVNRITEATIQAILGSDAVDSLLCLEPPLETVFSHPHEKRETEKVTAALDKVRSLRTSAPREAMAELGFVLKTIRNKREHAFKTRFGPRDAEILRPTRQLLDQLCQATLDARVRA